MKLCKAGMENRELWTEKGYILPGYNREKLIKDTENDPKWIHFGGGNIFRAFIAQLLEDLLNKGEYDRGIIVASGEGSVKKIYRPADNLSLSVVLKSDGSVEKHVLGCITDSLVMECGGEDWEKLCKIFAKPGLQLASFTITEKGYKISDENGEVKGDAEADFESGPKSPESYMGKIAALCYERYLSGGCPIALVSMDNCAHNGDLLRESIAAFAEAWEKSGKAEKGFSDYIRDGKKVSFTWSMIDKITPGPDDKVKKILEKDGMENIDGVLTEKKTNSAPFVNAEECGYLVINDDFPNSRPPLEKSGVIFTDKETVDKTERMKVCTCLNPLHTALAVYGCLLGYKFIHDEMEDVQLRRLIEKIGYQEGLKVVEDPKILNPQEFIDNVINSRFSNPFIPDAPQRIATDTSQKIPIRYGKTIQAYMERDDLDVKELRFIPLVFAGFLRYLMGIDDEGNEMELSPDPLKDTLRESLKGIKLGDWDVPREALKHILSNETIFGANLCEIGLYERVEGYFKELIADKGAVRRTLIKYLGD